MQCHEVTFGKTVIKNDKSPLTQHSDDARRHDQKPVGAPVEAPARRLLVRSH
jgi:hypothetical protein